MNKQKKIIPYRPDIDGLRAIAVLAVIFYHLDVPFISGGFVGVDIFFVISGYLISCIIYSEIKAQSFSLSNFYIRRIRRIFPLLFFILFITTIAASFILPQLQLSEFYASILSVAWFMSNIFFWLHNDYFSVAAELKPLLHTWSLSVEEQFYVFFPLLMLMLVNKHRYQIMVSMLVLLLIFSFVLSIYLSDNYSSANFYLAPTRAWEFLLGTLLAVDIVPNIKQKLTRQYVALLGFGMVIFSILLLDEQSVFPGVNALYPVLGTVLLIYAGREKNTNNKLVFQPLITVILSISVLRYIGLISYSLYLWHWPVIALLKNQISGELDNVAKFSIAAAVFILSALSYQFIERPFRNNPVLTKFINLKSGLLVMLIMSFIGGGLYFYNSYANNDSKNLQTREEILANLSQLKTCFLEPETLDSVSRCSFGKQNSDRVFLLWGDSHTLAMYPVFVKLANDSGWRGIHASITGCPPLLGVTIAGVKHCDGFAAQNIKNFVLENKIDAVFLVSRWGLYETGWIRNGRLMEPHSFVSDAYLKGVDAQSSTQVLHRAMGKTLQFLTQETDAKVNLLLPVPVLPDLIDKYKHEEENILQRNDYLAQRASIEQRIRDLNIDYSFYIIDPVDVLCPNSDCQLFEQGQPLYLDDNHLSPLGAMMLFPLLENALH